MSVFRLFIILTPAGDDTALAGDLPPALRRALDGRGVYGVWEPKAQQIAQRRGVTLNQLRTYLQGKGCTVLVLNSAEDDPAEPDSGAKWQARNGWVDDPASAWSAS